MDGRAIAIVRLLRLRWTRRDNSLRLQPNLIMSVANHFLVLIRLPLVQTKGTAEVSPSF
jgi:hypothetical protein